VGTNTPPNPSSNPKPRSRRPRRGPNKTVFPNDGPDYRPVSLRSLGISRPVSVNGFPHEMVVDLKYNDTFQWALPAYGANGSQIFRLNSLFDPDYTFTGHQPYFRDQLATLYGTYKVLKCAIDVRVFFSDVTAIACKATIRASEYSTGGTMQLETEQPLCSVLTCVAGAGPAILQRTYDIAQIQEVDQVIWARDATQRTAMGSNPAAGAYLIFAYQQMNLGNPAASTAIAEITLKYTVVCTDLIRQASS
jgi:hypothetical protein